MHPFLLFLLAVLSPPLLAVALLVPPYVGVAAATYIIYYKAGTVHPLADKLDNLFYIIDVYAKLYSQWSQHMAETSLVTYTLPLLALPLIGLLLAFWLTRKIARKLKDLFQLGASV